MGATPFYLFACLPCFKCGVREGCYLDIQGEEPILFSPLSSSMLHHPCCSQPGPGPQLGWEKIARVNGGHVGLVRVHLSHATPCFHLKVSSTHNFINMTWVGPGMWAYEHKVAADPEHQWYESAPTLSLFSVLLTFKVSVPSKAVSSSLNNWYTCQNARKCLADVVPKDGQIGRCRRCTSGIQMCMGPEAHDRGRQAVPPQVCITCVYHTHKLELHWLSLFLIHRRCSHAHWALGAMAWVPHSCAPHTHLDTVYVTSLARLKMQPSACAPGNIMALTLAFKCQECSATWSAKCVPFHFHLLFLTLNGLAWTSLLLIGSLGVD